MRLFNKLPDADNLINKLNERADKVNFSNQERAEMNLKVADALASHVKDSLSESTERSKARRFIAYLVIANFFMLFWLVVWSFFYRPAVAALIKEFGENWQIDTAFLMILGFFFTSYLLKGTPLKQ